MENCLTGEFYIVILKIGKKVSHLYFCHTFQYLLYFTFIQVTLFSFYYCVRSSLKYFCLATITYLITFYFYEVNIIQTI
jgi:hypothetical protein